MQSVRIRSEYADAGVASCFHGGGQFGSHKALKVLEADVYDADFDALALSVRRHAKRVRHALPRLR